MQQDPIMDRDDFELVIDDARRRLDPNGGELTDQSHVELGFVLNHDTALRAAFSESQARAAKWRALVERVADESRLSAPLCSSTLRETIDACRAAVAAGTK